MAINSRIGNKPSPLVRPELATGTPYLPGPFLGIVKNNIDPVRMGRIQVYIPELGGLDEEDPQFWRTVSYASPYFGITAKNQSKENTYENTQESYGFWMTTPDIGHKVICIFINGDPNLGYYIASVPEPTAHHMVPAIGGSAVADKTSPPEAQEQSGSAVFLPVTEYNILDEEKAITPDPYGQIERPIHIKQLSILSKQGLVEDRIRGVISSSSQRESPSKVYGFSTPGREVVKNSQNPKEVWKREGGHSFIMDDGTTQGTDQLVRLRSSAGHQIMLNDSAGIIYIINSNGTSWIEMGNDGSIRIFADGDLSVKANKNINFTTNSNFNIECSNFNLTSKESISMSSKVFSSKSTESAKIDTSKFSLKSENSVVNSNSFGVQSSGNLIFNGSKIFLNTMSPGSAETASSPSIPDVKPDFEPWIRPPETTKQVQNDLVISPTELRKSRTRTPIAPDYGVSLPPTSSSVKPAINSNIGSLTPDQIQSLYDSIGQSESNGDYTAVNSLGFSGKYQMGVAALEDLGYVKPGVTARANGRNRVLEDPSVWTGKDGISSQSDWLKSPQVQENAMHQYTQNNYRALVRNGTLSSGDTPAKVSAMLSVAHLVGPGGARRWANGDDSVQDAFGTKPKTYYDRGVAAVVGSRDLTLEEMRQLTIIR